MSADWILVAGASRGIGFALAKKLLDDGRRVVVSSRRKDVLEGKYSRFSSDSVVIIPHDFSAVESIVDFAERVFEAAGPLSGLVYCAGMQATLPLSMSKPDRSREIFNLNTFAAFELIRCFSRKKLSCEGASFVLISSLATHEGAVGKSLYAASKGALEGFLAPAAAELAQRNIRLNVIVPGVIKTEMSAGFIDKMTKERKDELVRSYPLGLGEPSDAANAIAWLLSSESGWCTGQKFIIDGGHMVRG